MRIAERVAAGGGVADRGTLDDVQWLWHGPGLPLLLAPLLALDLPLAAVRLLAGPATLFAAVLVFHRALRVRVAPRPALAGAAALGLYGPMLHPLQTVHKEPLAVLLVAVAVLGWSRAAAHGRRADAVLAGVALGALAMVRLEYGWVLVALLALGAAGALVRRVRPGGRVGGHRTALVAAAGLATCVPWLAYTRDVSGQAPYWGNASGESLLWMAPGGPPGSTGEFHGVRPVFTDPALASARPLLRRLDRLGPLERDRALRHLAAERVRRDPAGYARNVAANVARLWVALPARPAPPAGTVVLFAGFALLLLAALARTAWTLVRDRPRLPAEAAGLALFALLGLGVHVPPSADPRMTLPLVPVLIWLVVVVAARRRAGGAAGAPDHERQAPRGGRPARPLGEERLDRPAQVVGAEEIAGLPGDDRVGRPGAALLLGPDDRLRRGVGAGRAVRELRRERLRPVGEALVGPDAVDDAPALERRRVDDLAGHDELARAGRAGALGDPLGAAHRRGEPDDGLHEPERRGLGGDEQVAGQGELQAPGQAEPVGGEDGRVREVLDAVHEDEQVVPQRGGVRHGQVVEHPHVDAAGPHPALGAHEQPAGRGGVEVVERGREAGPHVVGEEVQRRLGDGQRRQRAVAVDPDDAHARSSAPARATSAGSPGPGTHGSRSGSSA